MEHVGAYTYQKDRGNTEGYASLLHLGNEIKILNHDNLRESEQEYLLIESVDEKGSEVRPQM